MTAEGFLAADEALLLLDIAEAAQALSHFLEEEKETFEPPSDLLDQYAALETHADYDREETLSHALSKALAKAVPDPGSLDAAENVKLTHAEALIALNTLRSNIVALQKAGWSDTVYPLVAILNAAGFEKFEPSEEQKRQHLDTYGGAGGYPGHAPSRA